MGKCYITEIPVELWQMSEIIMDEEFSNSPPRPFNIEEKLIRLETFKEYIGLMLQEMYCTHYVPRCDTYVCPILLRALNQHLRFESTVFKLFDYVRRNFEEFSLVMETVNEIAVVDEVTKCPIQKYVRT